jgi:hypothetical protein
VTEPEPRVEKNSCVVGVPWERKLVGVLQLNAGPTANGPASAAGVVPGFAAGRESDVFGAGSVVDVVGVVDVAEVADELEDVAGGVVVDVVPVVAWTVAPAGEVVEVVVEAVAAGEVVDVVVESGTEVGLEDALVDAAVIERRFGIANAPSTRSAPNEARARERRRLGKWPPRVVTAGGTAPGTPGRTRVCQRRPGWGRRLSEWVRQPQVCGGRSLAFRYTQTYLDAP